MSDIAADDAWGFEDALQHLAEQMQDPCVTWDHCQYIAKCMQLAYGVHQDDALHLAVVEARMMERGVRTDILALFPKFCRRVE